MLINQAFAIDGPWAKKRGEGGPYVGKGRWATRKFGASASQKEGGEAAKMAARVWAHEKGKKGRERSCTDVAGQPKRRWSSFNLTCCWQRGQGGNGDTRGRGVDEREGGGWLGRKWKRERPRVRDHRRQRSRKASWVLPPSMARARDAG